MASTAAVEPLSAMKESPNWLELPDELISNIFQRLRTGIILKSARKVCTTWQRICTDSEMWKVIDINKWQDDCDTDYDVEMLTKQAVDLSCGELIDISIGGFCTDEILDQIVLRSSKLKRLTLWCCFDMTSSGLSRAVKRVPQLEKLHLTCTCISLEADDIEVIGRNCPQLKSFQMDKMTGGGFTNCSDHAFAIANNMPELHHLEILGDIMENDGFQAIINGCRHLQSLHIYMSNVLNLDGNLVKECMERIKDFTHNSTEKNYDIDDMSFGSDDDEFSEEDD